MPQWLMLWMELTQEQNLTFTGTYAQYDNGIYVFTEYWNFAGSSLPAGWTADSTYTTAPVVNNGLTISSNGGGSVYRTSTTGFLSGGYVFETKMKDTNDSNSSTGGFTICNAQNPQSGNGGANALVLYVSNAASYVYFGFGADGSSSSYNLFSGVTLFTITVNTFWIASIVCGNATTNKVKCLMNYTSEESATGQINKNIYYILGLKAGSGAISGNTTHGWVYQWVRSRIDPPNDTNPSVSAGSLTPTAYTTPYIIDVDMEKLGVAKTVQIDTILKTFGVSKNLIDVDLKKTETSTYLIDTDIAFNLQNSYNIDSLITKHITINTNVYNIDALLNAPYPYSIDTDLEKLVKIDAPIDVLFKELGIPTTGLIDTILANARQYFIDTDFEMLGIPVQYAIDIDLQAYGVPVQYIIDSRFIKTYTSTYAVDMMMLSHLHVPYLIDTLLKKLDITASLGIDTSLLSIIPPIPPIYTQPTLMFNNPNGQLFCFPLTWKESQDCTPAIRQVPLAPSEYLDDSTYVLKSREIDVTFRVSDSEKALLEEIYNYASLSGANYFTDIYLYYNNTDSDTLVHPKPPASVPKYTWHYTAWLSNKDYKYEYISQDGRYVRWWTVSLTINVESFNGSSANEPDYSTNPFSMAIVLDGHKLAHILDFERSDQHPPMLPEWVNQPPNQVNPTFVNSYLWNECVLDMTYTDRMSNDEKYLMDLTLQNHQLVNLADYIHNVQGSVWVSSISAKYDANNWAKPWVVDVSIKANNNAVTFNSTTNLTIESWGVNNNGDHVGPDNEGTLYMDEIQTPIHLPSNGGPSGEQIVNGGFENNSGDNTPCIWWTGATAHTSFIGGYGNIVPHNGSYFTTLYETSISTPIGLNIPVQNVSSFTYWLAGASLAYVRVYYTDSSYSECPSTGSFSGNWIEQNGLSSLIYGKTIDYIVFFGGTDNITGIDDVSLITNEGPQIVTNTGVHVFYFFSSNPKILGFYNWNVSGNACIVQESSLDVQTFDRESRVSILIWGPATIIPQYTTY